MINLMLKSVDLEILNFQHWLIFWKSLRLFPFATIPGHHVQMDAEDKLQLHGVFRSNNLGIPTLVDLLEASYACDFFLNA